MIAYSTFKLTRRDKDNKKKGKRLHFYTYLASIIIIVGNISLWYINEERSKEKDVKIEKLLSQNTKLLEGNTGLFSGNKELFKGQKELLKENLQISKQNNDLSKKVDELKEVVIQKDNRIFELEKQVNALKISAPKIGLDGRIEASPYVKLASEFSDGITKARKLFDEGNLDEAFTIAQNLTKKKTDFGLAYFIMGTVLVQKSNYIQGDELLKKSIGYGMENNDLAWAYHNLGISSLKRNLLKESYNYFEKCVRINPSMVESKRLLDEIGKMIDR